MTADDFDCLWQDHNDTLRNVRRSRGIALLGSIMLILFLGLLIGSALMSMNMQLDEADERILAHDAFYIAEAGLEKAVFLLRQDRTWRPDPALTETLLQDPADPSTTLGTYTVRVAQAPAFEDRWPSVWIRSDAIERSGTTPRHILARVILQSPLNFLTFTLGDLTVRSGARYDYDLLARDVNLLIDTGLPPGPEHDIAIDGNVSYMRSINSNVDISDPDNGVVITGDIQPSPAITFSGVDLNYYRNLAQSQGAYIASNFSYSGNLDRTTLASDNGVVFVEGDLHINGQFTENMVFVASGNIYIDGNITDGTVTDPHPQIGLFASQDVIIPSSAPNNINIEAFILADGGAFTADKTTSKNSLNFTGAIAVRGKSSGLNVDLNAYKDRNYTYNRAFSASSIPFVPSIANIIEWREINPADPFPPED